MRLAVFALLVASAALATASPLLFTSHRPSTPPTDTLHSNWQRVGRAPASHPHTLLVALEQRNLAELKRRVDEEIASLDSPNYRRFLSLEEVADLTSPSADALETVQKWLKEECRATGLSVTRSRGFVEAQMDVAGVEACLGVPLHRYVHRVSGRVVHRVDRQQARMMVGGDGKHRFFQVPEHVAQHVQLVVGVHDFMDLPAERVMETPSFKGAVNSSAPDVRRVAGSEADATVSLNFYCKSGKMTSSAMPPCSDDGPAVKSLELVYDPRGADTISKTYAVSELKCALSMCSTPSMPVPPYRRANISARAVYEDGTTSETGMYLPTYAPASMVTPDVIHKRYNVPLGTAGTHPNNSQSVLAFEKQYINMDTDLRRFFAQSGLEYMDPIIHGENDPSMPGGESTLDIQYIMGVAPGVASTFWSVSGPVGSGHGFILEWAKQVANTTDAPLVTSISYGDTLYAFYAKFGSWEYLTRMESELVAMAARGMTVIAGSGDAGCSNVGERGNDLSSADPDCSPRAFYPSSSPYVTSLSSTYITVNSLPVCWTNFSTGEPVICGQESLGEVVVGISQGTPWTTGGGFSNLTARPSWQKDVVDNYLSVLKARGVMPPESSFAIDGRAYADVSVVGVNYLMVLGGRVVVEGGTSASGPAFAGLTSLLNDELLHAGKPPIGLLNPFLYAAAAKHDGAFKDVTVGTNADGDLQPRGAPYPQTCEYGFSAVPGYDSASGLGNPNWSVLRDLALAL